jgi:hypothetical protein
MSARIWSLVINKVTERQMKIASHVDVLYVISIQQALGPDIGLGGPHARSNFLGKGRLFWATDSEPPSESHCAIPRVGNPTHPHPPWMGEQHNEKSLHAPALY